jgi:hypothetical protein
MVAGRFDKTLDPLFSPKNAVSRPGPVEKPVAKPAF